MELLPGGRWCNCIVNLHLNGKVLCQVCRIITCLPDSVVLGSNLAYYNKWDAVRGVVSLPADNNVEV